jgi:DUF2891 family protein
MKAFFYVAIIAFAADAAAATDESPPKFEIAAAKRFAKLALACVEKEYPNKISHVLNSDADVAPPRKLTPAFYGCYDWHSSVHGHWLLVRLLRTFPNAPFAGAAREALRKSLTAENLKAGSCIHSRERSRQLRAPIRISVAVAAMRRAARLD